MTEQNPRLPEPGEMVRHVGRFVRKEVQEPTPPPTDYIFESTEWTVFATAKRRLLKEYGTFHDMYGVERGRQNAIDEAKVHAAEMAGTGVVIQVVERTRQQRFRTNGSRDLYDSQFYRFEPLQYGGRRGLPEDTEDIVWSSDQSADMGGESQGDGTDG